MAHGAYAYGPALDADVSARRESLVLEHLPQVRLIAKRIHDRLPDHISLDDLVSNGVLGLLAAIDNFDPSFNVQLKTYAERRIRGAILDSLREMDCTPREQRKRSKAIEAAMQRAKQRLGREPAEEEIAAELQMGIDEYRQALNDVQLIELEPLEYASDGEEGGQLRFLSDDESAQPSSRFERSELERILTIAIERMPKLERTVLTLYYFEELNLRQISQVVSLHLSRVAQIRVQAVIRLRSHLQRVWMSPPRKQQH
jgi:RNA polymerase sigma factor for flagellar operon FliA